MNSQTRWIPRVLIPGVAVGFMYLSARCGPEKRESPPEGTPWWNQRDTFLEARILGYLDTAEFVGATTCGSCHADRFHTYMESEMANSWRVAHPSRAKIPYDSTIWIVDSFLQVKYRIFWEDTLLIVEEHTLAGTFTRRETVAFFVGSAHHTQSHLWQVNGFLYQAPVTYYVQKGRWDLAPGFARTSTRFDRSIMLECITCHSDFPDPIPGYLNRYAHVAEGISCERCHGPGSVHVQRIRTGNRERDSLTGMLLGIIHPGKLPPAYQMHLCARCHMQGVSVLQPGASFMDFLPGMWLTDVMTTCLPALEPDTFLMASHVERLMRSPCFQVGKVTCITCHDPHVSVRSVPRSAFIAKCLSCHGRESLPRTAEHLAESSDCISCHMPSRPPVDIPHVWITDHWIRIPDDKEKTRTEPVPGFHGLRCFPPPATARDSAYLLLKAYLKMYERFWREDTLLKRARHYLAWLEVRNVPALEEKIHYYFLREDWDSLVGIAEHLSPEKTDALSPLNLYRIGEACFQKNRLQDAYVWWTRALQKAPGLLEVRVKRGIVRSLLGDFRGAREDFRKVLQENPRFWLAHYNLAVLYIRLGEWTRAKIHLEHVLRLNPLHEGARRWLAEIPRLQKEMQQDHF